MELATRSGAPEKAFMVAHRDPIPASDNAGVKYTYPIRGVILGLTCCGPNSAGGKAQHPSNCGCTPSYEKQCQRVT